MEYTQTLYCAEQIRIPPTLPYLLRQYAKAAIRTQPIDLLKWSSTYFRCLSLNCPPPVKTKLEYPIPRDWHGLTPGWIRSLDQQIHPNTTVSFKVLWDRWMGSCLNHEQLIEILCIGGYTDPENIPWLRFVGICSAVVSDSLTQTMILVCEVLTDEPEGGSACITIENFLNIYKYLAIIDASLDQTLLNKYFTNSLLGLWSEKREEFEEALKSEEGEIVSEPSVQEIEEVKKIEIVESKSCPSIEKNINEYLQTVDELALQKDEEEMEEGEEEEILSGDILRTPPEESWATTEVETEPEPVSERSGSTFDLETKEQERQKTLQTEERQVIADMDEKQQAQHEQEKMEVKAVDSSEQPKPVDYEDRGLLEDLARLRALQVEMGGEDDYELEKFKRELIKELEKTPSELEAMAHFASKLQGQEEKVLQIIDAEETETKTESEESKSEIFVEEEDYEEIQVAKIPGIGPRVPDELIKEVEKYMKAMAKLQHGMVMPRNIRHYDCPPLEEVQDLEKEVKELDTHKKQIGNN